MYDEGKGDPYDYKANPSNSTFAEGNEPNCYPDSRVNQIYCSMDFRLTKHCTNTDKIEQLYLLAMPIQIVFREQYEAQHRTTAEEVQDILCLQKESTDQQGYPLWTGTKLDGKSPNLAANVPGLTGTQGIEHVNFNTNTFYGAIQYYTNAGAIKAACGKRQMLKITKQKGGSINMKINIPAKNKYQNPYSFFGILLFAFGEGWTKQLTSTGDASTGNHIGVSTITRYLEWNENFDFARD